MLWDTHYWRQRYHAQKKAAQELSLSYDAVRIAPYPLTNSPVLWRLGRVNRKWYYQGDLSKPIHFLNDPDLPLTGRKGMDGWF